MSVYNNYHIKEGDRFAAEDFPLVVSELRILSQGISHIPATGKGEMIVSFVKDHALNSEWVKENPTLSGLITSRVFPTSNIESLFDSCRGNITFKEQLQDYIMNHVFLMKFKNI
jgi:hypothetical protein